MSNDIHEFYGNTGSKLVEDEIDLELSELGSPLQRMNMATK